MGGVYESEIPKINKIYLVLILGICLRPTCLWCHLVGFEDCLQFFCEKTCSQVDVEEKSVSWSGNWDWHERNTTGFQIACLTSVLCVWYADICVTWSVYRWFAGIHSFPSLLPVISFSFMLRDSPSDLESSNVNRRSWVKRSWAWWGWRCLVIDKKGSGVSDGCS